MSSEVARPEGSAFELFKSAATDRERFEAGKFATTAVAVPGFAKPVPPLFFDLPWNDDTDEVRLGILAQIAGASDIEKATQAKELRRAGDIIGQPVEVLGVAARVSDVEDADWGAYVVLTCSVDGGDPEAIPVGAPEVCVVMWRVYCEGKLPVRGTFVRRGREKAGRDQPIGFQLETDF